MAKIEIKDATVSFVNGRGNGYKVEEHWQSKGEPRKTRYSIWPDQSHGVKVGDVVSLSGLLTAKVDEWTGKDNELRHTVDLAVNSARLVDAPASDEQEPWGDANVPF